MKEGVVLDTKYLQMIETLFLEVQNSKPGNNNLELLPKVLLAKIFCYVDEKNLSTLLLKFSF